MKIYWIVSYPRSGGNWARAFIATLMSSGDPLKYHEYCDYVPDEADPRWYQQFEGIGKSEAGPTRENMERRRIAQEKICIKSKQNIVLRTRNALVSIEGLPIIRDDLTIGAIYIVRDPRDVAVSLSRSMKISIDDSIELLSKKDMWIGKRGVMGRSRMFEFIGDWSNHVTSWARANSAILRYEDLHNNEKPFLIMASTMNVLKDSERIRKSRELCRFDRLRELEDIEVGKGYEKSRIFESGKSGQWKNILTVGQAKRIEINHKNIMNKLNYI